MRFTLRLVNIASLICVPLAAPQVAQAVPITYTIAGNANITFGGGRSGNTPFTIRVTGDAADIVGGGIHTLENIVANVQVSGFPPATFTNNYHLLVNNPSSLLTFGDGADSVIQLNHPSFSSYNLATNLGPIFFPGGLPNSSIRPQPTTLGQIIVAEIRNVTFTAAVPEPSASACFLLALGWLFSRRRR
jgi:hypothetical protein